MKLFAVTLIRNEADILPSFLRHVLAFFDGGHLLDHRSTDESTDILKSFCAAHPAWSYTHLNFPGFFQSDVCRFFLKEAFKGDADAVVLLDADEFVAGPRDQFEKRLTANVPFDHIGLLKWRNCIPESFDAPFEISAPLWVSQKQASLGKVAITREFFENARPGMTLFPGNHWVSWPDGTRAPMREFGEVCHVPLRSKRQATLKGLTKVLGYLARGVDNRDEGTHNFELVDLAAADLLSDDELVSFVNAYGLRAEQRPIVTRQSLAAAGFVLEQLNVELSDAVGPRRSTGPLTKDATRLLQQIAAVFAEWGLDDAAPEFVLEGGQLSVANSSQPRFRGTQAQKQNVLLRTRIEKLEQEFLKTRNLVVLKEREIARLHASRSWRYSKPFRRVMRQVNLWRRAPRNSGQ